MSYPPDFNFELKLRRLINDELNLFIDTSSYINGNPDFRDFLVQYNSYQQYIRSISSTPDSWPFIDLLIQYELLLRLKLLGEQLGDKENTLPIAIGLIRILVQRIDKPVNEIVSEELKKVLDRLDQYEKDLREFYDLNIKDALTGLQPTHEKVNDLHRVLVGDPSDLPAIQRMITQAETNIRGRVNSLEQHFDEKLKELEEEAKESAESYKKEIIETICEEIPNRVVGESYYRYNSTSSFYPTLFLVFIENTQNKYPRRSQLKVKIKKSSEEITEAFIDELKRRFNSLYNKRYTYGTLRACYVSSDKTYKNTLFVHRRENAETVFQSIYSIVDLPFDRNNLSITEGRNRKPITRRNRPLAEIQPEVQNYNQVFEVDLYRVVLQINGLQKPILIFKSYDP